MVVVLPDPFRGMGVRRNSTVTQQSGHTPRSGPEVKMEEGVPKRLRCLFGALNYILRDLTTQKYFYTSFLFGTCLSNMNV